MRYKCFLQLFTTAAVAGALTLLAAPQTDYSNSQNQAVTTNSNQQTEVASPQPMSDWHMWRKIHKMIARDPVMSRRAEDVRIVCRNGQVTLKGSVPTTMEKDKIENDAVAVAGTGNVIDQIKVKHPNRLG